MKYKIRQEQEGDEAAIVDVIARAFAGKSYADEGDATLVDRLREAGGLILSLVATQGKEIVGQVALSAARVGDGKYLCVGPLAVAPHQQRKGIGSDLMGHALGIAQAYGRDGVVLQGDLHYYSRFGFKVFDTVTYDGDGAEYIQLIPFEDTPTGAVVFHRVFSE
ncbi:GNAT family N-acetyltransferase [Octadecabacter ascidiaceicola]|uniref:Acetyltransferase (GNAT) family protein n=1 Tax=Octadecabacter ascidiaceicola TaxID=1655543 RepID=A0A238JNW1_9RHOB|nr:N-acetyltransferase [Octadecabacter ascidiaceicola]SMX32113.1 Acetyltransferase (GNAT) family protein [Octadecabacter ascidiaceicola]